MTPERPIAAVGVVCMRDGEVLLVRRGAPPRKGEWSLPGGRIELGERAADAALRELREETGVEAEIVGLVDVVDGLFPESSPRHYVLIDFAAVWRSGDPTAGDDAVDAAFVPLESIDRMLPWSETRRVIREAAALISERRR